MTTLRDAVLWCCRLDIPWSAEDVAQMAATAVPAAKAYLVRQAQEQVIILLPDGRYRAGDPKAIAAYRARTVNPKPGGNSAAYRRAKEARDRLLTAEANARRAGNLTRQDETAQDNPRTVQTIRDNDPSGITRDEAATYLRVTTRTIDRWVRSGRMKYWRTPGGQKRIPISELINRITP